MGHIHSVLNTRQRQIQRHKQRQIESASNIVSESMGPKDFKCDIYMTKKKTHRQKMCFKHPMYATFLKSSMMKIWHSPKLYVKISINFSAQNVPPKTSDQYILLAVKWRIRKVYLVEFDFCGQDNMHHAVSWHTELLLRHSWQMTEGSPRHVAWYSG